MENKVVFGLKNARYAIITENEDSSYTYGTPIKFPGATSLGMEPKGETAEFFADDTLYYSESTNQGYDTTFTVANITDQFRIDVLGEVLDPTSKTIGEYNTAKPKKIALLFEFDGDIKATRHVLYSCSVSRPNISGNTKTTAAEPGTTELKLVASPRPSDGAVRYKTTVDTPQATYDNWYTSVFEKTTVPATSVTLLPDTTSLAVGGIQQLAATVLPANATNRNVSYSSSNTAIATVSNTGLVTAKAVGSATITVTTADGSFTDATTVTVA